MDRVYVGNLPPDIEIKDIDDFFRPFGELVSIEIKKRCKALYALIQFDNESNAINAVRARCGSEYEGYNLQVKLAGSSNDGGWIQSGLATPPPPPPKFNEFNNQSNSSGFNSNNFKNQSPLFQSKMSSKDNEQYVTSSYTSISSQNSITYPTHSSRYDVSNRSGDNTVTEYKVNNFNDIYDQDLTDLLSAKKTRKKALGDRTVPYNNPAGNLSKYIQFFDANGLDVSNTYPQNFNMAGRNSLNYANQTSMSRSARCGLKREKQPQAQTNEDVSKNKIARMNNSNIKNNNTNNMKSDLWTGSIPNPSAEERVTIEDQDTPIEGRPKEYISIDYVSKEIREVTSEINIGTNESVIQSVLPDTSTIVSKCLDNQEGTPFIKLNSAEKRRFKKALIQGLTREQALIFAQALPVKRATTKRVSSDDEKVAPTIKNKKTNSSTLNTTNQQKLEISTCSGLVDAIKLGFISNDMSKNPLTNEQMALLQEAVIDTTIELGDDVQPEFEGYFPRTGWLMVACSNRKTADFLIRNIQVVRDKCKIDVSIVEESEFSHSHFVIGYFPHSLDLPNDKILSSIAVQNGLKAKSWKVVRRKNDGTLLRLLLAVDKNSWDKLCELNGRIAYRFSHINLILKDANKELAKE